MRMQIRLTEEEREALYRSAETERRDMRQQAAWLIRSELKRRGLLAGDSDQRPVPAGAKGGNRETNR